MQLSCVKCNERSLGLWDELSDSSVSIRCTSCGTEYQINKKVIIVPFEGILKQIVNIKAFLTWKVLNNNGYLSYQFLPEGSLSLPSRTDVNNFKSFILQHSSSGGALLDVGCGVMEVPGYLDFSPDDKRKYVFYGLDPINSSNFFGRIIVSSSEFIPVVKNSFDVLIFATSLDHVCSLEKTFKEANRVLRPGGRIIIWMSDRSEPLLTKIKSYLYDLRTSLKLGYNIRKYYVYSNGTVLHVPPGAIDPFHSWPESPKKVINFAKKYDFKLIDCVTHSKNQNFICLEKIEV